MIRLFMGLAMLSLGLAACSLTPQGACSEQGLSAGTAAYEQCVADKTAAAQKNQFKRVRHDHGR